MEYLFYLHIECINNKVVKIVQKAPTLHNFNLCNVNQNILSLKVQSQEFLILNTDFCLDRIVSVFIQIPGLAGAPNVTVPLE